MKPLVIQAPAKINIYLDVLQKRPDGYHDIKSLAVPISLFDNITLEPISHGIIFAAPKKVHLRGIPWTFNMGNGNDNLVCRAACLLQKKIGRRPGVKIKISKRIPIGGGLGGGSADAAAVLVGLNQLWQAGLSQRQLIKLGAQLGSDIPALIHGGSVVISGRGEKVRPGPLLQRHTQWITLVNPGITIATADIFSRYKPRLTYPSAMTRFNSFLRGLKSGKQNNLADGLYNALQDTVYRKYPLLKMIHTELEKSLKQGVLLAGSGATIFAFVENYRHGCRLATQLRMALGCPLWIQTVRIINKAR